jgi:hypothetical protein
LAHTQWGWYCGAGVVVVVVVGAGVVVVVGGAVVVVGVTHVPP